MIDASNKKKLIAERLDTLRSLLESCSICGNRCGIDRVAGEVGYCRTESQVVENVRVASSTLHFGEEPMLVGVGGSGTVFMTHCNLRCVFCQNHQISQEGLGEDMHYKTLSRVLLGLQAQGAENINLVTPTHYIYPILMALAEAYDEGLNIPIVYNTNGYDAIELLELLDGIVDLYLPDAKYMSDGNAYKYSGIHNYPAVMKQAIKEMWRQTGPVTTTNNVAKSGLIIRHLILPADISNTYDFLIWLRGEQMLDVTLSLMRQYSPQHKAHQFPELNMTVSDKEYRDIVRYAIDSGFNNLLTQGLESTDIYLPDFQHKGNAFANRKRRSKK